MTNKYKPLYKKYTGTFLYQLIKSFKQSNMRNQHVIYHKQIHKHYSHARTLTIIILLQILKHSFKIP